VEIIYPQKSIFWWGRWPKRGGGPNLGGLTYKVSTFQGHSANTCFKVARNWLTLTELEISGAFTQVMKFDHSFVFMANTFPFLQDSVFYWLPDWMTESENSLTATSSWQQPSPWNGFCILFLGNGMNTDWNEQINPQSWTLKEILI
jgi:hypothetical protein